MTWKLTINGHGANEDAKKNELAVVTQAVEDLKANGQRIDAATFEDSDGHHHNILSDIAREG